jgi:hypothetical protein
MPFLPPPPPPGPPAPTFGSAAPQTVSDGESRNLLLQSIRQGTALKKTVTNDRSLPIVGKFQLIHSFIHLFHIPVDPNTGTQHHRIWNVSNIQGCFLGYDCSMPRSCVNGIIRLVL